MIFFRWMIVMLLCFMLWSCGDPSQPDQAASGQTYPDQEIWQPTITLTKDGMKRAIVKAGHLTKYNNQAFVSMDAKVEVDFFDSQERHMSHLTAREAKVYENSNDFLARGNVIVVSDSGMTLFTEEVRWVHQREKIISDKFITLTTAQDTLYGVGFESDSDLKNWVIFKPTGVTDREINPRRHE